MSKELYKIELPEVGKLEGKTIKKVHMESSSMYIRFTDDSVIEIGAGLDYDDWPDITLTKETFLWKHNDISHLLGFITEAEYDAIVEAGQKEEQIERDKIEYESYLKLKEKYEQR